MSRYALEWAKIQIVASHADKLVLVILGDHAQGRNHSNSVWVRDLVRATELPRSELLQSLERLRTAEIITFEVPKEYDHLVKFALSIPVKWRPSSAPKGSDPKDVPTAVYRFYDTKGQLLYVGIADNPTQRWQEHKRKPWWWEVVTREITWYPTRLLAKAEEDTAFATEDPIYNDYDTGRLTGETKRRPRLRYAHAVTGPERYREFKRQFDEALAAGKLDDANRLLLPIPEIAKQFDVDAAFVIKAFEDSREIRRLASYEEQAVYRRRGWY